MGTPSPESVAALWANMKPWALAFIEADERRRARNRRKQAARKGRP